MGSVALSGQEREETTVSVVSLSINKTLQLLKSSFFFFPSKWGGKKSSESTSPWGGKQTSPLLPRCPPPPRSGTWADKANSVLVFVCAVNKRASSFNRSESVFETKRLQIWTEADHFVIHLFLNKSKHLHFALLELLEKFGSPPTESISTRSIILMILVKPNLYLHLCRNTSFK